MVFAQARHCHMSCHRLPKDEGPWTKPKVTGLERVCRLHTTGTIGVEKHLVFESPEMQESRDRWAILFSEPTTVQEFVWQEDLGKVAKLISECLDKFYAAAAGLSHDGQASDQPEVADRDVTR